MAETLWLQWGSYQGAWRTVDLFSGLDGIYVRDWVPAVSDGRNPVDEVINLKIIGSSKDDLATKIQKLDEIVHFIQHRQEDPAEYRMGFLTSQLDGESNWRRAPVLDARLKFAHGLGTAPTTPGNVINNLQLGITREPFWEAGTPTSGELIPEITMTNVSCSGGLGDYGSSVGIAGTDPARIDSFNVELGHFGIAVSDPLVEFWFGFRSDMWGDRTAFEPIWECEDADAGSYGSNVSLENIAGTSSGQVIRYDAPNDTDALADRFTIRLGDAVAYPGQQRGIHVVLLRARCTSTRTFQVRMSEGFYGGTNYRAHSRVGITKPDWYLYPLGVVTFPPGRYHQQQLIRTIFLHGYSIKIAAGVLGAGSGDLECDCLYLIPQSEGACYVKGTKVRSGNNYFFTVWADPDGTIYSTSNEGNAYLQNTPIVAPTFYGLPPGRGSVIVAGQHASDHDWRDKIDIVMRYNARWRTLRGGN